MNEPTEVYTFQYSDGGAKSVRVSFTPGDTWPEVLEQFVSFLNNIYGYDIHQKVGIVVYSPLQQETLVNTWTGPVFNPEDEL